MKPYSQHSKVKTSALVGIPQAPAAAPAAERGMLKDPRFFAGNALPSSIGDLSFATMTPQQFAAQEQLRMLAGIPASPAPLAIPQTDMASLLARYRPASDLSPRGIVGSEAADRLAAASTSALKDPGSALFKDPDQAEEFRSNSAAAEKQRVIDGAMDKAKADAEAEAAAKRDAEAEEYSSYLNQAKRLIGRHPMAAQFALYGGGGALAGAGLAAALSSKKNRIRNALLGGLLGGGLGAFGRHLAYKNEDPHVNAAGKGLEDAYGNSVAPRNWAEGMGVGMSNFHM